MRKKKVYKRHFTVAEANALIPELQKLMLKLQAQLMRAREEYGEEAHKVFTLSLSNGHKETSEPSSLLEQIHKTVDELHNYGVVLKDLEMGLVDFPHMREGQEVFLCWRLGEESISYYHELDKGFSDRRSLFEDG